MAKKASLKKQMKTQTVTYLTAGLGLVAGLAWNEAIRELIDFLFPNPGNTLFAKFVYAFLLTAVVAGISALLVRLRLQE
jgi:hypothetical protein